MNDAHSDWNERLPYVMVAYRSSVNETAGNTPNMIVLRRELTVPLDIQFANSLDNKQFHSEFVSNLQYRMEHPHEIATEHIPVEMRRRKRYHDRKLFWEKFLVGDEVFVLFHRNQTGKPPKVTCYDMDHM